jgi:hypothetical protein
MAACSPLGLVGFRLPPSNLCLCLYVALFPSASVSFYKNTSLLGLVFNSVVHYPPETRLSFLICKLWTKNRITLRVSVRSTCLIAVRDTQ